MKLRNKFHRFSNSKQNIVQTKNLEPNESKIPPVDCNQVTPASQIQPNKSAVISVQN